MTKYNVQVLTELLEDAFSDPEITKLAFTLFRPVHDNFGEGLRRGSKIRDVIEYAENNGEFDKLIQYVKEERKTKYDQYAARLVVDESTDVSDQDSSRPFQSESKPNGINQRLLFVIGGVALLLLAGFGVFRSGLFGDRVATLEPTAPAAAAVVEPTKTAVSNTPEPTIAPIATITPTPTVSPSSLIAPIADDEIMVLVAQFEPLTEEEREVSRFIVDDLQQTLEKDIPFSNVRVRKYPQIIKEENVVAIAEEVGAAVIVWGNYDETAVFAEIQVGSMEPFLQPQFDRSLVEQSANVRARLMDERRDSIASYVMNIIILQQISSNELLARSVAVNDAIDQRAAELLSGGVAKHLHQFSNAILSDENEAALDALEEALGLDGGNPFTYFFLGSLKIQLGEFQSGTNDMLTAQRFGPASWVAPLESLGLVALFQEEPERARQYFSDIVEIIPEEWRAHYYIGLTHLLSGQYPLARTNMEKAIMLEPDVNWAHIFALQIAIREGRLTDAVGLSNSIIEQFPDPAYGTRVLESTLGGASIVGPMISAFGNSLLGQYQSSLNEAERALSINNDIAELHWLRGYALCNLGEFERAIAAYSAGIDVDATFPLNYLSRGSLFWGQGKSGSEEDFQAVIDSDQASTYQPLVDFVRLGYLNCQNLLSFSGPNAVIVPTIVPATPVPAEEAEMVDRAVVVQPASIYIAPFNNSVELGNLAADAAVTVNGRSEDNAWLYIMTEDGLEGFVDIDLLTTEIEIETLKIRMPKYGVARYNATVFRYSDDESAIIGYVATDELLEIIGRSPNGSWFYVRTDQNEVGFVSSSRVIWQGNKLTLPLSE